MKYIGYAFFCASVLLVIGYLFWQKELQYALPTKVPTDLKMVEQGNSVNMATLPFLKSNGKPSFIHFYNNSCPCSRFNAKEFKLMVLKYKDSVDFYAVIQVDKDETKEVNQFKEKYDLGIPIYADPEGKIAASLGVYATPQAVIVNTDSTIYYKGNYNRARYCVSRNTRFAEMAVEKCLNNEPPPQFGLMATTAYGCSLPSSDDYDDLTIIKF